MENKKSVGKKKREEKEKGIWLLFFCSIFFVCFVSFPLPLVQASSCCCDLWVGGR
jgi:hypothetical protein